VVETRPLHETSQRRCGGLDVAESDRQFCQRFLGDLGHCERSSGGDINADIIGDLSADAICLIMSTAHLDRIILRIAFSNAARADTSRWRRSKAASFGNFLRTSTIDQRVVFCACRGWSELIIRQRFISDCRAGPLVRNQCCDAGLVSKRCYRCRSSSST